MYRANAKTTAAAPLIGQCELAMCLRIATVGGLLAWTLLSASVTAQPETDIYLVPLLRTTPTPQLGNPENITNRAGYDNQPQFVADGSGLLFSSMREGGTDIFLFESCRTRS